MPGLSIRLPMTFAHMRHTSAPLVRSSASRACRESRGLVECCCCVVVTTRACLTSELKELAPLCSEEQELFLDAH